MCASNCLSRVNKHVRYIAYKARNSVLFFGSNIVTADLKYLLNCVSVTVPLISVAIIRERFFCCYGFFNYFLIMKLIFSSGMLCLL